MRGIGEQFRNQAFKFLSGSYQISFIHFGDRVLLCNLGGLKLTPYTRLASLENSPSLALVSFPVLFKLCLELVCVLCLQAILRSYFKSPQHPGIVVDVCNLSTRIAESGGLQ